MITVVIVGVLAALAIPGYTGYLYRSRAAEGPAFLAEIGQREESYRAEFSIYADCRGNWAPRARSAVNSQKVAWVATDTCWRQLAASTDGHTRFAFVVEAGGPGDIGPLGNAAGAPTTELYFVSQAVCDLNGDGTSTYFEAYSSRNSIYVSSPRGWE
jgi:type II secretory pathway pseudopilin PulG